MQLAWLKEGTGTCTVRFGYIHLIGANQQFSIQGQEPVKQILKTSVDRNDSWQ